MDEPSPLSFCTMDELWTEISSRTETAVMAFVMKKDDQKHDMGQYLDGNIWHCLGLSAFMHEFLEEKAMMAFLGVNGEDIEGGPLGPEDDSGE